MLSTPRSRSRESFASHKALIALPRIVLLAPAKALRPPTKEISFALRDDNSRSQASSDRFLKLLYSLAIHALDAVLGDLRNSSSRKSYTSFQHDQAQCVQKVLRCSVPMVIRHSKA